MAQTLVEQVINEVRTLPEQEFGKILDFVTSIKRENIRKGTKPLQIYKRLNCVSLTID